MRWFYVAEYQEDDAHSRDFGKRKFCLCSANGWSRRGLRLDRWHYIRAQNGAEAKRRVSRGEGVLVTA